MGVDILQIMLHDVRTGLPARRGLLDASFGYPIPNSLAHLARLFHPRDTGFPRSDNAGMQGL